MKHTDAVLNKLGFVKGTLSKTNFAYLNLREAMTQYAVAVIDDLNELIADGEPLTSEEIMMITGGWLIR